MPDALPSLPIGRLTLTKLNSAPVATLMITEVGSERGPYLSVRDPHRGDDMVYAFDMSPASRTPFTVLHAESFTNRFLAIDTWRLIVDPTSAYLATRAMPGEGDAFISDGKPGWMARWEGGEGFIGEDGMRLPTPDWGNDYVGFTRWSILIDDANGEAHTVLSVDRPSKKEA